MKKTLVAITFAVIAIVVGAYQFGYQRGYDKGATFMKDKMHVDQLTKLYEDQCIRKGAKSVVNNQGYLNCVFPDGTQKTIWSMFE